MDEARAINAEIGRNYDAVMYDPPVTPALDPVRLLGLAALYGCGANASFDVLDLGCGTGRQLSRAGTQTQGKLVGVDVSSAACERAGALCAPFGDRVRISSADLLDLEPTALGQFDLIYSTGVIYVTPKPVQQKLLALIGACLKPGGAVMLTYYAGVVPRVRAAVYATLRASIDASASAQDQVRDARARLAEIAAALPSSGAYREMVMQVVQYAASQPDVMFFHEALNHAFEAMNTASIASDMSLHGLEFLDYLTPTPFGAIADGRERAQQADIADLASGGGYRYAMFGKPPADARGLNMRAPNLRWTTALRSIGVDAFNDASGAETPVPRAETQVALARMAAAPISLANADAGVTEDILALWQRRLVAPLWTPAT